jgi:hypothetical protein
MRIGRRQEVNLASHSGLGSDPSQLRIETLRNVPAKIERYRSRQVTKASQELLQPAKRSDRLREPIDRAG